MLHMLISLLEGYRITIGREIEGIEKFLNLVAQFFPKNSYAYKLIRLAVTETAVTLMGQSREDGDAKISHPVAVAITLLVYLGIRDYEVIVATILHDNFEDFRDEWPPERIERSYGTRCAHLVCDVSKPELDLFNNDKGLRDMAFQVQLLFADFFSKVMKLADRLHNLITIWEMLPEKRIRKVEETREFYIPQLAIPLNILVEELQEACEFALLEHDHMDH